MSEIFLAPVFPAPVKQKEFSISIPDDLRSCFQGRIWVAMRHGDAIEGFEVYVDTPVDSIRAPYHLAKALRAGDQVQVLLGTGEHFTSVAEDVTRDE